MFHDYMSHWVLWNLDDISVFFRHAVAGVVVSWMWSFVWNTAPLFGWGSFELEGMKISCAPNWHGREAGNMSYIIFFFLLCFAVPFSIIIVSYLCLLWTLHQVSAAGDRIYFVSQIHNTYLDLLGLMCVFWMSCR